MQPLDLTATKTSTKTSKFHQWYVTEVDGQLQSMEDEGSDPGTEKKCRPQDICY